MNSIHVAMIESRREIESLLSVKPRLSDGAQAFRNWDAKLRRVMYRQDSLLQLAGPVVFGCEQFPRDYSRWQMTREEWAGQE
jgi:hypothetical protein